MAGDPRELEVKVTYRVDEASAQKAAQHIRDFGTSGTRSLNDVDRSARRLTDGIRVLDANISPGRLLGWALGWSSVYRAINLVTGAIREGLTTMVELDKQLHNVATVAKISEQEIEAFRKQIRSMSTEATAGYQPMVSLAQALYQINSSGILGAQSMDVLRASAAAARAGLTTTEVAAGALTAVINAYSLAASDAGRVSDILFKTTAVGVPPFEQLARHIGEVAATASVAKIPVEELGLVWAATSRVMSNAALTTTGLNRLILSFVQPSSAMKKAVKELGYDSALLMAQQLGLVGAMRALYTITGDNAVAIRALFQDQRAFRTASVLLTGGLNVLTQAEKDWGKFGEEAGATQEALTKILRSQATEVDRLHAEWTRFLVESATQTRPFVTQVLALANAVLQLRRQGGGFGAFGAGLGERFRIIEELNRRPFQRTPSEISRGQALQSVRRIDLPRPAAPGFFEREPTLEDLLKLFEQHQRGIGGGFTTANEIRAISELLLPKAAKEAKELRSEFERLQRTLGEDAEETVAASRKVEAIERTILDLQAHRIDLARDLAEQYKRQGELLQRALENVRRADVAGAEAMLAGHLRQFDLGIEALEKFRDLMKDTFDADQARKMREEIAKFSVDRINSEIIVLRRLMETAATPRERVEFAQRLQEAIGRKAGVVSRFGIEAREQDFAAARSALERRIQDIDVSIAMRPEYDPGRRSLEFLRQDLQRRLMLQGQLKFTREDVTRPYAEAASEIARIQRDVIDPALRASADEARGIAKAALDQTNKLYGDITAAWSRMGKDSAAAFIRSFVDEYGRIPQIFQQPQQRNYVPQGSVAGALGGGNVYVSVGSVDLTEQLSPSARRELAAALIGAEGNQAVRQARILYGRSPSEPVVPT